MNTKHPFQICYIGNYTMFDLLIQIVGQNQPTTPRHGCSSVVIFKCFAEDHDYLKYLNQFAVCMVHITCYIILCSIHKTKHYYIHLHLPCSNLDIPIMHVTT
ncbi:unnamed protein product [Vicia faba]|uniref:Uncharacterized protein n=1 Tax=Vicia faba TaxID=3906 RepID=A0AAV1AJP6_VICFA|nr:unnamed protein product [Vicia faba]